MGKAPELSEEAQALKQPPAGGLVATAAGTLTSTNGKTEIIVAEPVVNVSPVAPPKRTKVAIVGFASHWNKAPFDETDYEIWTLNEFYQVTEQMNKPLQEGRARWFELHNRQGRYEGNPFGSREGNHAQKLAGLTCPVYMCEHWDDIPNSIEYPLKEAIRRFGGYLTNTISYMIALAIMEDFERIEIYGVDMAQDTEYETQRPSCEYFIGLARGAGIEVYLPPQSDLLMTPYLYGFEAEKAQALIVKLKGRVEELKNRLNHNNGQEQQVHNASMQLIGAIEDANYIAKLIRTGG